MKKTYFCHRKAFSFSSHPFQIGSPIGLYKAYEDNHFLLRIYSLPIDQYNAYYSYHLNDFLAKQKGTAKEFFDHVRHIVSGRISYYNNQNPFASRHGEYIRNIECLKALQLYLESINEWSNEPDFTALLTEKEQQIADLKEKIKNLETQLEELRFYESKEKISIAENKLPTFIDLLQQLQELTLPNNKTLLKSQTQSPWYKLLSKYFLHGEKEIPINTARNYFPAQKGVKLIKGSEVPAKDKHFQIVPIKDQTGCPFSCRT